ncbi:unnamed protein product [Notodromas monacha]|uniref:Sugar transporter SWEET n=1 Tax=Notodromas monacha TaxID=399045 RepID=A0A7R9G9U8_9CRUS|nr:unnamed protein product [Notodromas monacha]CAG0914633.1 unnamed protein product [Notodromas monacha]
MDIAKKRNVGGNTCVPFLCSMLGSAFWFKYATLIGYNPTMIIVNTMAIVMNSGYLWIYYLFCGRKPLVHRYLMAILALIATTYWYVDYVLEDREDARCKLGLIACCISVLFTASPLVLIGHVIETRSTEALPLLLIASTFLVSVLWLLYGMVLGDTFVTESPTGSFIALQVQNGISVVFGLVQLALFAIYPRRRGSPASPETIRDGEDARRDLTSTTRLQQSGRKVLDSVLRERVAVVDPLQLGRTGRK